MALGHLLSIVIPTKERQEQCVATVRSVLAFDDPFELIVFDSSADGALLERALRELADERVRHLHVPALANMTQCFEQAVSTATGEYICMIGDDDGVTRALFEWARCARNRGLSSVTSDPRLYASYNWPGIRSKYFGAAASGKLFVRLEEGGGTQIIDARSQVSGFLQSAGQGCGLMPRVYHGLVARSVLADMRSAAGRCFDGVSPDVSFSYLSANFSPRHAIVNVPLTISGASVVSNAGRSAMRQHKGDLWSDPHMRGYAGEPWPDEVPQFFSVETVWGQATLAAIDRLDGKQRRFFNFPRFYALLLIRHPDRWRQILGSLRMARGTGLARSVPTTGRVLLEHVGAAAVKLVRRVYPDRQVQTFEADTIEAASAIVDGLLRGRAGIS
jgi:glycosyltransferase involved in cell wall biosynthesis